MCAVLFMVLDNAGKTELAALSAAGHPDVTETFLTDEEAAALPGEVSDHDA